MASHTPKVHVYGTSIMSSSKIRSNHEKVDRIFKSAGIEHVFHDISWDEAAKQVYKRKNGGSTELPLIVSGGVRCGSIEQLEDAVEFRELETFLRLDQDAEHKGDDDAALLASLSPEEVAALAAELGPATSQLALHDHSASTDSTVDTSKAEAIIAHDVEATQEVPQTHEVPPEPVPTPVGAAAAALNAEAAAHEPEATSNAVPEHIPEHTPTSASPQTDESLHAPDHASTPVSPHTDQIPSTSVDGATAMSTGVASNAQEVTSSTASDLPPTQTDGSTTRPGATGVELVGIPKDEIALKEEKEAAEGNKAQAADAQTPSKGFVEDESSHADADADSPE